MSKGKYAAKAINRAAATDNEVIVDLRRKLSEAEAQRDSLASELDATRRRMTGEVNRRVDSATADERARMREALDTSEEDVRTRMGSVSDELLSFVREWCEALERWAGEDFEVIPAGALRPVDDTSGPSLLRILNKLGVQKAGQAMSYALRTEYRRGEFGTPARDLRRRSTKDLSRDLKLSTSMKALRAGRPDMISKDLPVELVAKGVAMEDAIKRAPRTTPDE